MICQPGTALPPFIEQKKIEICRHCAEKVLKITANEEQDYSEYKIIEQKSEQ